MILTKILTIYSLFRSFFKQKCQLFVISSFSNIRICWFSVLTWWMMDFLYCFMMSTLFPWIHKSVSWSSYKNSIHIFPSPFCLRFKVIWTQFCLFKMQYTFTIIIIYLQPVPGYWLSQIFVLLKLLVVVV